MFWTLNLSFEILAKVSATFLITWRIFVQVSGHCVGGINYNDITYNINKCNITYMFLSTVISKVIFNYNQL
jgi:hypothetical protein